MAEPASDEMVEQCRNAKAGGGWGGMVTELHALVARIDQERERIAALEAENADLGKEIAYLECETRCPECGCSTPQEAEANECGCDAPVCAREVPRTLAEHYRDAMAENAALRARLVAADRLADAIAEHQPSGMWMGNVAKALAAYRGEAKEAGG